ncbi:MAG: prepilin-type N-terminal cleavage/methylation domain-containing protein [Magnetococcales bacterium]|nr:prepilin-type N-terminal cleavage/methylation domain-containing protein [Magnetococcales bacterium]
MRREEGFTLLELSIVLLVVGLLLQVVLQGGNVVEEARIKRLAMDVEAVGAAARVYVERYHALPGDDPLAGRRWPESRSGDGDGTLGEGERAGFWEHLRRAGLFIRRGGGLEIGFGVLGLPGLALCFTDATPEAGRLYDLEFDDGEAGSGRVRSGGGMVCASL